jgi:hypothetical protein
MSITSKFRAPIALALVTACAICVALLFLPAQTNDVAIAQEIDKLAMQQKLALTQELLRHLTVKDFDKMNEVTKKLANVSQEAQWLKLPSARYNMFAAEFRFRLERLGDAAENENIQGATLNYTSLIRTCVECHEEIREGKSLARLFDPSATSKRLYLTKIFESK